MRAKIGIVGVLGFGLSVTVALGQPGGQRAARLLPPRPTEPAVVPTAVRAAAEPLPPFPDSTPVTHINGRQTNNAWLNGTNESHVRPVGATTTVDKSHPRPATATVATTTTPTSPDSMPKEVQPSFMSKSLDKLKTVFSSSAPQQQPQQAAPPVDTNANSPFRGTSANGQTVYAGPPAYRWYGWGSVTPGANPYAPTGHFPRASANWYSITGATPGAFPTQVVDSYKVAPGTEPPMYVPTSAAPYMPPAAALNPQPANGTPTSFRPSTPMNTAIVPRASAAPAGTEQPRPAPVAVPAPVQSQDAPPPTLMPLPTVGAALPTPQVVPATIPTMSPPPAMGATSAHTPLPVAETEATGSRTVVARPALTIAPMTVRPTEQGNMPPLPTLAVLPPVASPAAPQVMRPEAAVQGARVAEVKPLAAPAPLPVSMTEEPKWQPTVAAPVRTEWKQQ